MSKIRLLSAALLIGVFAVGILAGLGISRGCGSKKPSMHRRAHNHLPGTPGPIPGIDLSPEQKKKADAIREKYRPELEAIVKETFPRVREINLKMEAEFRKILNPEQTQKLNHFKKSLPTKRGNPPTKRR
jgi:Spy/CpxP family protein refolding chaperone